jgi:periplasmic protein TonB
MYSEENRALSYAIAASIVLHGVLLFGIAQRDRPRPVESQMPSILARLAESPAAAPAAESLSQPAPARQPQRARAETPKRLVKPAPAPTPQPAAEPAIEPAPVAEAPAETISPEPPAPAKAGEATVSAAATAAASTGAPPAEPAVDPGSLERYRLELKLVAAKYKRYPRTATDNNWKGVVALRVVVGPSGQLASLTVTKTSGHEVLDRQAQEMFRNAAADVPVPPVLRGKQFAVDVAVDYYLTD